jgi:hypothetical protein
MFRAFMASTALFLLILGASEASAQNFPAYRVVAQGTGNCLKLKAPEQTDGGGLTTAPCQNFADFFVTIAGNPHQPFELQFRLTSSRYVCIVAPDNPTTQPIGQRSKVTTRNCGAPNQWDIFGPDSDGFVKFDKISAASTTSSEFCIFNNTQSGEIELEACQGQVGPVENWKLDPVFQ